MKKPQFHGGNQSYLKYEEFCKKFKSWSRKNHDKTNLLHLLKDCLNGPAANMISELELNDDNYAVAWQILDKEYKTQMR